jgi:translation elongation factor EF-1alpha
MAKTGQTRTHALLAYAFGIRSVVVAVTQMDNLVIPYSRKRYEWCQAEVFRYLKRVGFVQDRVTCLPVSGLCGDNIVEPSKNLSWYLLPLENRCASFAMLPSQALLPSVSFPVMLS